MSSTTVNFNLKTAGFDNYANQTLTFRLLKVSADKTDDTVILPGIVTATSAANGTGSAALFTTGESDIESTFEVIFPNREKGLFQIPATSAGGSIHLSDLLVDHVPGGSAAPQNSVYDAAVAFARQRANHTGNLTLDGLASGSITGKLAIANGGTNASSVSAARTSLGAQEQKDVLDDLGALSAPASDGQFIVATGAGAFQYETAATARTSLGLGTIATQALDSVNIDGGAIDGAVIGAAAAAAGTFSTLTTSSVDINGGAIDGTVIGAGSAAAGTFSALTAPTTNLTDATNKRLMTDAQETKLDAITLPAGTGTTINAFARDSLLNSNATSIKSALGVADTSAIAGFVPNSITFPATSAFLSIANEADLNVGTGDFTLSFWARLDSDGTQPVLDKFSGIGYSLKFSSGSLVLTMQDAGGPLTCTFGSSLNDNKWHVYVVSVDRDGNAVAYIDNVAQTALSVTSVDATLDNTTVFRIGFDGSNAGSGIALGNYIALHKSALTAAQAAQVYFSADAALTAVVPTLMVDLREVTETFTDVSASPLPIVTNGSIRFNQDRLTEFTGTNVLATSTLGYKAGSGGTTTQPDTSGKSTTTNALDKINGEIVMDDEALAANTTVSFTLTNNTIAATDVVIVNHASGGTAGAYQVTVGAVASGTCLISVRNVTGSPLGQAIKLNFAVIKAVKT